MQDHREQHDTAGAGGTGLSRRGLLRRLLDGLFADTRGATLTQQVMVIGLALAGMAGFSKFGSALHEQLEGEAARIQGRGKPGLALSLGSLAPSFQPLPLACPGGSCRCFAAGTPVATGADGEGGGLVCNGRGLAAQPADGAQQPAEDAATERARASAERRLAAEQKRREREQRQCERSVAADLNRYRRQTRHDYTPASGRGRPKTREQLIATLCEEMSSDCRPAASLPQCLAQARCLARRAAEHDNFTYFGGDQATRNNLRAICSEDPDLVRSCYKGAPIAMDPAFGGNPKNAQGHRDPKLSQQAGEAAARAYQQEVHPEADGWTCFEDLEGVPNVFDLACYHEDGRVAIIEAKGGNAGKGERKNAEKSLRVEQGTLEYVTTISKAIRASGKGGGKELANRIDALAINPDAIESGRLSYVLVRQPFRDGDAPDGSALDGDPLDVRVRHFDLNAENCN